VNHVAALPLLAWRPRIGPREWLSTDEAALTDVLLA
jgi:hypothetical protein